MTSDEDLVASDDAPRALDMELVLAFLNGIAATTPILNNPGMPVPELEALHVSGAAGRPQRPPDQRRDGALDLLPHGPERSSCGPSSWPP